MRLSYSALLVLAIFTVVSFDGVSAGGGRVLKTITKKVAPRIRVAPVTPTVTKVMKPEPKAPEPVEPEPAPAPISPILITVVVVKEWTPATVEDPHTTVDPTKLNQYVLYELKFYLILEDSYGKFFYIAPVKFYIVIFKVETLATVVNEIESDPQVICVLNGAGTPEEQASDEALSLLDPNGADPLGSPALDVLGSMQSIIESTLGGAGDDASMESMFGLPSAGITPETPFPTAGSTPQLGLPNIGNIFQTPSYGSGGTNGNTGLPGGFLEVLGDATANASSGDGSLADTATFTSSNVTNNADGLAINTEASGFATAGGDGGSTEDEDTGIFDEETGIFDEDAPSEGGEEPSEGGEGGGSSADSTSSTSISLG